MRTPMKRLSAGLAGTAERREKNTNGLTLHAQSPNVYNTTECCPAYASRNSVSDRIPRRPKAKRRTFSNSFHRHEAGEKSAACHHGLMTMRGKIRLLRFVQRPFAWAFWRIERMIATLDVESERRKS